jgi:hypothetical protein
MSSLTLAEKIAKLDDQQALSIVDSLAGEFAGEGLPEGRNDQASALTSVLASAAQPVDAQAILAAETHAAAKAARELLQLMAEAPQTRAAVEGWLDQPPGQEMAPIPLLLAAPVVLTGCIAFLTLVGSLRFHRSRDGKWEIDVNPSTASPLNRNIEAIARILAGSIGGGGAKAP